MNDISALWAKYDQHPGLLSPDEIQELIRSANQGILFLSTRGESGGLLATVRFDRDTFGYLAQGKPPAFVLDRSAKKSTLWSKFDHGDGLTNKELQELQASLRDGIQFLKDRGETGGVLTRAILDQYTLDSFARFRNLPETE
jgi:hypothetical protein